MDGFTKLPKMQCFKEGGSIQPEMGKPKKVKEHKGVPAVSKKDAGTKAPLAFGLKGTTPDVEDESTTAMKKGGRAKKSVGTVKKYKTGGSVTNVYEAKKSSGDLDNIKKTKDIKPTKAAAPSKAATKPAFKGSDVAKEKSKASGDAVSLIKSKQSGKSAAAPSGAKGGPNKYKTGGEVKKMADGGGLPAAALQGALPGGQGQGSANDMERRRMMARAKMAMQTLGPAQQSEFVNQGGMSPTGASPAPAAMPAPQGAPAPAAMPAQKKGGKVKGKC